MNTLTRASTYLLSVAGILGTLPLAQAEHVLERDSGRYEYRYGGRHHSAYVNPPAAADYIVADGLFARPLGLAATAVGTAVFIVTLPFSLPSGNVEEVGRVLVRDPAAYTFQRCMGCFKRPIGEAPYAGAE